MKPYCEYFLLCTRAQRDEAGLWSFDGVLEALQIRSLPAATPGGFCAAGRIVMDPAADSGRYEVELVCVEPDGTQRIFDASGATLQSGLNLGGRRSGHYCFHREGFAFSQYGPHEFILTVDGERLASTVLAIVRP